MNQEKQPEALRIAAELDKDTDSDWHDFDVTETAATEFRRLHAENEQLKSTLAAKTGITIGSLTAKEIVEIPHANNLTINL